MVRAFRKAYGFSKWDYLLSSNIANKLSVCENISNLRGLQKAMEQYTDKKSPTEYIITIVHLHKKKKK